LSRPHRALDGAAATARASLPGTEAAAFDRLAPRTQRYIHAAEGPDDMPAHIRTVLSGVSLSIPVMEGQMVLGAWQSLYLVEHRDRPHRRDLVFHLIGA